MQKKLNKIISINSTKNIISEHNTILNPFSLKDCKHEQIFVT